MRAILLATFALATTASAALADPAVPASVGRTAPVAASSAIAAPAGPVELSDGQMDGITAGGTRTASSSGSREST
jgi:hypothetical protein